MWCVCAHLDTDRGLSILYMKSRYTDGKISGVEAFVSLHLRLCTLQLGVCMICRDLGDLQVHEWRKKSVNDPVNQQLAHFQLLSWPVRTETKSLTHTLPGMAEHPPEAACSGQAERVQACAVQGGSQSTHAPFPPDSAGARAAGIQPRGCCHCCARCSSRACRWGGTRVQPAMCA